MDERQYWYWLANIDEIGYKRTRYLLEYFKTPINVYDAEYDDYIKVKSITDRIARKIIESKNKEIIKKNYETTKNKVDIVLRDDENYPNKLRNIYDPPYILYVRGKLPNEDKPGIAIVGARNCSKYGESVARYMARELSKIGFEIVSGMAKGIDAYAHYGVIDNDLPTYGVLGCGADICYPECNFNLYMKIIQNGGVISEFPLGTKPKAGNFIQRNRIISGMCDGVLVVESSEKSGSLITANYGLAQGKEVYAVPGKIGEKLSEGCNKLIQAGAKLVTGVDDILEDFESILGCKKDKKIKENYLKNKIMLESHQKIVYDCLRLEPIHIEEIVFETKMNLFDVMNVLFELESQGLVIQTGNNYFSKV